MTSKAVIYSRVSTTGQDTKSQIKDLEIYAKLHNIHIVKIFDEQISGAVKTAERESFNEMETFIKAHNIDTVICWELSRIGRSTVDIINTIDRLTKDGIKFYFKKEDISTIKRDPMSNLFLTILSSFAEFERAQTTERTKRGKLQAVKENKVPSKLILGYDRKEDKTWKLNLEESQQVKTIFETFIESKNILKTCKELTANNIFNKGGKEFTPIQLKRLLKNKTYTGEFLMNQYDEEKETIINTITIEVPKIIDLETFNQAAHILKARRGERSVKKHANPLTSATCGICGAKMYMQPSSGESTYFCSSERNHTSFKVSESHNTFTGNNAYNVLIDVIKRAELEGFTTDNSGELKELETELQIWESRKAEKQEQVKELALAIDKAKRAHINNPELFDINYVKQINEENQETINKVTNHIESINTKLSEMRERKVFLSNPSKTSEGITTSLGALEDFTKGLRITVQPVQHKGIEDKFYTECWVDNYRERLHGKKRAHLAFDVPMIEGETIKQVKSIKAERNPNARAIHMTIQSANWTVQVIYTTLKPIYSIISRKSFHGSFPELTQELTLNPIRYEKHFKQKSKK